ncbi:MAG: hypothetical protein M3Q61_03945, partial [Chloroflexota bacterium]|nr:hypothetical protein [Chloroflexota bacterium]
TVSALRAPQASCIGAPLIARLPSTPASTIPTGKRSLILTNTSAFAPAEGAQVLAKLAALAAHATVDGHVLDLATDANIVALRADWLTKPTCVAQANLLTDAIRAVVQLARTRSPIEYLIIGGGDRIVPFRREADWAEISRESRYSPPVLGSSASDASLVADSILTDDFYATATPIERVNRTLYLPDIAVGRLVESAADIGAYVDMYIARNGRAAPTSALSSGYDFTLDLAQHVTAQLQARGLAVNSSLVSNTWSADQWRATVLDTATPFGILSLQGHFSANRLVPADNSQRVLSTEIAGRTDGRFRGALVYSLGCHSGYSITDPDALQGLTQPVAFPEAFVRQGATLVGGTGYQYGETVLMKNTEALIALLTTELGYSTDARGNAYGAAGVPIGKALMYAKRAYMGDTATPRGIDFKVVGVSTVYGSPTMSFALPSPVARPQPGTVAPSATAISGLGVLDQTTTTSLTRVGASPSYYTGASGTTVAPYRPIAPLVTIPAEAVGSVLAGVVFMGGAYTEEQGFVPRLSIPATEESGEAPRYVNDTFSPTRPVRTNLFDGDAVQLIPFQYRSDATGTAGTARVFGDVRYRAYYSSVTGAAAIVDAPPIERVSVSVVPTGIEVRASVRGHILAEIADVYVTHTDTSAASRSFASIQMAAGATVSDGTGFSGFTREYTALIPAGANAASIRFMVQAVSGTGRVEVAANGGQLFSTLTGTRSSTPPAVDPTQTQLSVAASPQAPAYRSTLTASAVLSGLADSQLAGRPITFTFGGVTKTALTNAQGAASTTFDVRVTPGTHQLTASYAGGANVLGSAASTAVQVQRAAATLTVTPAAVRPPDGAIIATLTAGGVTLNEQPIVLRVGSRAVATATDFAGRVRFETLDFPATTGPVDVTVEYAGNARYHGTSADVVVTVYDVRTFATAGGWIETASGRANITFDGRYHERQTRPNGKVQVQTDGKLVFRSTSIEWLRIVDDTIALAGEGTVNGKAGYRYLIEAIDAASDTVSVKIWDATGSATSPTHAIAGTLKGGTVKIHR